MVLLLTIRRRIFGTVVLRAMLSLLAHGKYPALLPTPVVETVVCRVNCVLDGSMTLDSSSAVVGRTKAFVVGHLGGWAATGKNGRRTAAGQRTGGDERTTCPNERFGGRLRYFNGGDASGDSVVNFPTAGVRGAAVRALAGITFSIWYRFHCRHFSPFFLYSVSRVFFL